MKPLAVHHVSINVDDLAAALEFYVDVLGLTERSDRPAFPFDGAWLDAAGQQVHLIVEPWDGELGRHGSLGPHFALEVADLDATVAELRARGLEVTDPRPVSRNSQAFLQDPCGNVVELQQVG
jgi:catechol 2,3-dioxygenase-like lactoylglutathione lyase family enzyme